MISTLLLRLDGPMQSWSVAEFNDRPTMPFPTKSGIVGLLANAHARERDDAIDDLAGLAAAVRADDAGLPLTDFQTAGRDGWRSANGKVHRDTYKTRGKGYLVDAVFTVALTGPNDLIEHSAAVMARPSRPLFLGRRCCPPASPLLIGISKASGLDALRDVPYQGHRPVPPDRFIVVMDADRGEVWDDHPESYAPGRREYRSRHVVVTEIEYAGQALGHPDGSRLFGLNRGGGERPGGGEARIPPRPPVYSRHRAPIKFEEPGSRGVR